MRAHGALVGDVLACRWHAAGLGEGAGREVTCELWAIKRGMGIGMLVAGAVVGVS